MHEFAILVALGLGTMLVTMFAERLMNLAQELRAIALAGVGIGLAWAVDFNLWRLWGLPAREDWVAVTLTGLGVAGVGYLWHVLLEFFAGLARKFHDEAASLEKTADVHGLPRLETRFG
ncbi:MAG: hypothetical protein C4344_03765, partial [Acidimicrobiia bacterium]